MISSQKPKIMALIPARSGSKSVPNKNIRLINGKPLLAYSVEHALASAQINRVIVSTDSEVYAQIAQQYGAETPFLRPAKISGDASTDLEAFTHTLNWLAENEGYHPDICVHLRPTHPVRRVDDTDRMIEILLENEALDSVRSVSPSPEPPFKMWFRGKDGLLSPVVKTDIEDACNLPRQNLPLTFLQNAATDVVRARVITQMNSMTGRQIFGYVMDRNFDIDTETQFRAAEAHLTRNEVENALSTPARDQLKIFCFDVDGVIATLVPVSQYQLAHAQPETVKIINTLYKQGHRIIIFTARGSATGMDWVEVTRNQLARWGVKYHQLLFGKPAADYYIDDKLISMTQLQEVVFKGNTNE